MTWPIWFDLATAASVARNPEQISNIVYASRLGNGPAQPGEGLIQASGWVNYQACGSALSLDLLTKPEWPEQPAYPALSASSFWSSKGLNEWWTLAGPRQSLGASMTGSMGGQIG